MVGGTDHSVCGIGTGEYEICLEDKVKQELQRPIVDCNGQGQRGYDLWTSGGEYNRRYHDLPCYSGSISWSSDFV